MRPAARLTPGRSSRPATNSSEAPPPVERWEMRSGPRPSLLTAARESPPPTTVERGSTPATPRATVSASPRRRRRSRRRPCGPFQNDGARRLGRRPRRMAAAVSRPDVHAEPVPDRRIVLHLQRCGGRVGLDAPSRDDVVHRQQQVGARSARRASRSTPARVVQAVGLDQRVARPSRPARLEERVCHGSAHKRARRRGAPAGSRCTASLSDTLAPPSTAERGDARGSTTSSASRKSSSSAPSSSPATGLADQRAP